MVTFQPADRQVRYGRRTIAIGALLLLLVGGTVLGVRSVSTVAAETVDVEQLLTPLPASFKCVTNSGVLAAGVISVVVWPPPASVWAMGFQAIGLTAALAEVLNTCHVVVVQPLGQSLQLQGPCDPGVASCPIPDHGSVGGGGGGGGGYSW